MSVPFDDGDNDHPAHKILSFPSTLSFLHQTFTLFHSSLFRLTFTSSIVISCSYFISFVLLTNSSSLSFPLEHIDEKLWLSVFYKSGQTPKSEKNVRDFGWPLQLAIVGHCRLTVAGCRLPVAGFSHYQCYFIVFIILFPVVGS